MSASSSNDLSCCQLQIHRALETGEHFRATWLAWKAISDQSLRWAWQDVLNSLGFGATKSRKASIVFYDNYPKWLKVLLSFGLQEGRDYMKSQRSMAQHDFSDERRQGAEDCHWLSTGSLLALLYSFARGASRNAKRSAPLALLAFLEQTLAAESLEDIWTAAEPATDDYNLCSESAAGTSCPCWNDVLSDVVPVENNSAHIRVRSLVLALHSNPSCPLVAAVRNRVVHSITHLVQSRAHFWGNFNWHMDAATREPDAKRRRLAPQLRTFMREQAKGGKSVADAVREVPRLNRALAWRYVQKDLQGMQANAVRTKPPVDVSVSVAFDASRFGRPSKDYLLGHISSASWHCFAPPQD
eukprot:6485988-Amphidinium_carterae.3